MLYHTIIKKRYYHIMNENDIWLIAGLGNPEAKYDGTRHNAGFAALDALADKWNISVARPNSKACGDRARWTATR